MSVTENDDLMENSQAENGAEISLEFDEEQGPDDLTPSDAAIELAAVPANPPADDLDSNVSADHEDGPLVENSGTAAGADDEAAMEEKTQEGEPTPGGDDTDINDQPENDLSSEAPEESQTSDFEGFDDDEIANMSPEPRQPIFGEICRIQ